MSIILQTPLSELSSQRQALMQAYRMDEDTCLEHLLSVLDLKDSELKNIHDRAYALVKDMRGKREGKTGLDSFLQQYQLSTDEGIALMCLAEALLRIPDTATRDKLIHDKLGSGDWQDYRGQSASMFVNAATWGLLLTGHFSAWSDLGEPYFHHALKRFVARSGQPVVRKVVGYAMQILGKQFVMGETIQAALKRAQKMEKMGYRFSYDMLGEGACTDADALRYYDSYHQSILAIGKAADGLGPIAGPGISIKLSAIYPRYEFAQRVEASKIIGDRLLELAIAAKGQGLGLTVDAEESDRLDISLDIIERVFCDPALKGWEGFGLAIQSYQKRCLPLVHYLADVSKRANRRWMVRLIKGAYWDTEIKMAQERGLSDYPVFTRKRATDVSFLACAKTLLSYEKNFFPQFATHNAYSVAAVLEMLGSRKDFEFQCLHGMGRSLYDEIVPKDKMDIASRIYAPVGGYQDLLAYLVRRLLENGANSSFVNRIADANEPIEEIIAAPSVLVAKDKPKRNPHIPLPIDIFKGSADSRSNSKGIDMTNSDELKPLMKAMQEACASLPWQAGPLIKAKIKSDTQTTLYNPHQMTETVGFVIEANADDVATALEVAKAAEESWRQTSPESRALILNKMADLLEKHQPRLMAMLVKEAGKTIPDAISEVREAIDFCRYYAREGEAQLNVRLMPGITGERNEYRLLGRGTMVCISPWNFPLAIFLGQVSAALMSGNCVLAKPAEQTPLIAAAATDLFYSAGIPKEVLQLLPGRGEIVGAALVASPLIAGVLFTGSTETARLINRQLADRQGPIVPFIAETGGQNVMIVDASALPEQVVRDVLSSAFGSAGQRCSALRVLYLQEDVADKIIELLLGAMACLKVGDPGLIENDLGPVIDKEALGLLNDHLLKMEKEGRKLYQISLPESTQAGTYFAPCAFEIKSLSQLSREVFGPFLHIIRYKSSDLDQVMNEINATGYGLTFGVHSRINSNVEALADKIHAGNVYVNRNMIGAVVGVQPFGGEGLSGTGPKAGGPYYLARLCTEKVISINTTAAGGNASLLASAED